MKLHIMQFPLSSRPSPLLSLGSEHPQHPVLKHTTLSVREQTAHEQLWIFGLFSDPATD